MQLIKDSTSLRALDLIPENLQQLQIWLEDKEVVNYAGFAKTMPQTIDHIKSYLEKLLNNPNVRLFGIYCKDKYIGNIRLDIEWLWRIGTISILIGRKDLWGQGYGTDAIELISAFAFNDLGLIKLEAGVLDGNEGSLRAFQKAGFDIEGYKKKNRFCNGKYVAVILLGRVNVDQAINCNNTA